MPDTSKPRNTERTAAQAAAHTDTAARHTADAAQQGGRAASEAARRGAEVGADLTRQGVQAGAEVLRRGTETATETARRSAQAVAESQRRLLQDAVQTFEEAGRKVAEAARGTSEDVRRLLVLPNAAEGGLRDTQRAVAGLVEGVVQTNLHLTQELFRLANPAAVVEVQQRFMREYLDTLMQGTATLVRAMRRTADETLGPLEEQVERRRQEQHRQAAAE